MANNPKNNDDLPDEIETDLDEDEEDPDAQKEVMREWFYQHYTDPVDNTPYESAEGGYQYIWGGPYDPQEELSNQFSGKFPDEVIEELADELANISSEWTGNPDEHALDEYEFDTLGSSVHRESFDEAILIIQLILDTNFEKHLLQPLWRQQYTAVFTAMETYLFDFFYSVIQADKELFRKFVKINEEFGKRKFSISELFEQHEKIEQTAREFLANISWHNLPRVEPFYNFVLGIRFDKDLFGRLSKAVLVRHDIVHRNGKKKDGETWVLSKEQIIELISWVRDFVQHIEMEWRKLKKIPDDFPF
jgi:hypothetical protein